MVAQILFAEQAAKCGRMLQQRGSQRPAVKGVRPFVGNGAQGSRQPGLDNAVSHAGNPSAGHEGVHGGLGLIEHGQAFADVVRQFRVYRKPPFRIVDGRPQQLVQAPGAEALQGVVPPGQSAGKRWR